MPDRGFVGPDSQAYFVYEKRLAPAAAVVSGGGRGRGGAAVLSERVDEFHQHLVGKIERFLNAALITKVAATTMTTTSSISPPTQQPQLSQHQRHQQQTNAKTGGEVRGKYTVRPATAADWPQIKHVHEAAFKACHAPLLETGAEMWFDPTGTCFVAEEQSRGTDGSGGGGDGHDGGSGSNTAGDYGDTNPATAVAGFVYCCSGDEAVEWAEGAAFVDDLYVSPDHQRQGLGRVLLRTAEQHLAQKGCETVVLATMSVLTSAHAFYNVRLPVCAWHICVRVRCDVYVSCHQYIVTTMF